MKKILKIVGILLVVFVTLLIISPELLTFCIMGILASGVIFCIAFVIRKLIGVSNKLMPKDTAKKKSRKKAETIYSYTKAYCRTSSSRKLILYIKV